MEKNGKLKLSDEASSLNSQRWLTIYEDESSSDEDEMRSHHQHCRSPVSSSSQLYAVVAKFHQD